MTEFYSFLWQMIHYVYVFVCVYGYSLSIHNEHLGCFHILATVNNVSAQDALNMLVLKVKNRMVVCVENSCEPSGYLV